MTSHRRSQDGGIGRFGPVGKHGGQWNPATWHLRLNSGCEAHRSMGKLAVTNLLAGNLNCRTIRRPPPRSNEPTPELAFRFRGRGHLIVRKMIVSERHMGIVQRAAGCYDVS